MHKAKLTLPLLFLGASCTALLGVEEGVLDEGSGGAVGATTTSGAEVSSSASGDTSSASASTTASSGSASTTSSTSSVGGSGGGGGTAGTGGAGGDATTATGTGGDGGAGGLGSGGATASNGAGGDGGAASSGTGGEGGGCDLPALPVCAGLQANTFSVTSDLTDFWDVLAPQASVTVSDELQLRIGNGTSEARIEAKTSLDDPSSCAAWIRFVTPNIGAGIESGLAIVAEDDAYLAYHLEGELRVRDPLGGLATTTYGAATALVRARFDEAGDLWFDASPDGDCWDEVDGPFALDAVTLEVQLYVDRPGNAGNAASTFDDFSR
jgi:hypothetical protein